MLYSGPTEMAIDLPLLRTIITAIAGMALYFICFKSTRENVVRIVAAITLKSVCGA